MTIFSFKNREETAPSPKRKGGVKIVRRRWSTRESEAQLSPVRIALSEDTFHGSEIGIEVSLDWDAEEEEKSLSTEISIATTETEESSEHSSITTEGVEDNVPVYFWEAISEFPKHLCGEKKTNTTFPAFVAHCVVDDVADTVKCFSDDVDQVAIADTPQHTITKEAGVGGSQSWIVTMPDLMNFAGFLKRSGKKSGSSPTETEAAVESPTQTSEADTPPVAHLAEVASAEQSSMETERVVQSVEMDTSGQTIQVSEVEQGESSWIPTMDFAGFFQGRVHESPSDKETALGEPKEGNTLQVNHSAEKDSSAVAGSLKRSKHLIFQGSGKKYVSTETETAVESPIASSGQEKVSEKSMEGHTPLVMTHSVEKASIFYPPSLRKTYEQEKARNHCGRGSK